VALALLSVFCCANASEALIRMLNILLAASLISESSPALISRVSTRSEIVISAQGAGAGEVTGSAKGPSVRPSTHVHAAAGVTRTVGPVEVQGRR